jgi:hypothetical protein
MFPAQVMEPRDVAQLARRTIRLCGVEQQLALETDDPLYEKRQLANTDFVTGTDVD